jgi:hypothetical protein
VIWEALVDRALSDDEIVGSVTTLLPVAADEVLVVADVTEATVAAGIRVLCERHFHRGEFPFRLTLYLRDELLRSHQERQVFQGLSGALRCACLVSDGSPSPHSMLLMRGPGRTSQVWLDPDLLDDGEHVLLRPGASL